MSELMFTVGVNEIVISLQLEEGMYFIYPISTQFGSTTFGLKRVFIGKVVLFGLPNIVTFTGSKALIVYGGVEYPLELLVRPAIWNVNW